MRRFLVAGTVIGASVLGAAAWAVTFAVARAPSPASAIANKRPPNLIIILTDDQGYSDVGFNGCKDIPTPNLDAIAQNGVRCSNGYVSFSVCSPSRAGLLTGRYEQRFGHERNPQWLPEDRQTGLPLTETTLADTLGKVGYRSGIVGKWHLGAHPDLHPLRRGFNEFFGHLGGGHRYLPEELVIKETNQAKDEADSYRLWIMRDQTPVRTSGYLTDEFSDEAVRFIDRNKEKPFFLYLAYNAPHAPLQAPEKYMSRFAGIKDPKRRTYAAMVSAVDDGVGLVLAELRKQGLEEDTMVFYLSDNGGPLGDNGSTNHPLRGKKSDPWEGGWRVPFAVQWPGHLPKGAVYDKPVLSLDIFATIATLASAPMDPTRPLDGVNLMPFLTGQNSADPHDAIYLRMFDRGAFAVRSGDYKLVIPKKDAAAQLYNLETDISESRDLQAAKPDILEELEKRRVQWNMQLIEPVFGGLKSKKEDELPQKKGDEQSPKKGDEQSPKKGDE